MQTFKLINLENFCTAPEWINAQFAKPRNAINGSLWNLSRPQDGPIGTVICNNIVIKDSGNGDGFGVGKDGVARFGRVWNEYAWRDMTTGYPGLIRNGVAIPIPATFDPAVVNAKTTRSVICKNRNGVIQFACYSGMTLKEVQHSLLLQGAVDAVAMDGGGSCFLFLEGLQSATYKSTRKLTNLWAEYDGESPVMIIIPATATANECYKAGRTITPKGLMIHSIGTPQPSGASLTKTFNTAKPNGKQACVHAFIQPDGYVYQTLPWNYRGWHCGSGTKGSGNDTHIGVEMTEPASIKYGTGANWTELGDGSNTRAHVLGTYKAAVDLFTNLEAERAVLLEEQALLSKLNGVYTLHKADPIDVQRASFFSASSSMPPKRRRRPGTVSHTGVLCELLSAGPATPAKLAAASGLSVQQVYRAAWFLKRQNQLVSDDGRYAIL